MKRKREKLLFIAIFMLVVVKHSYAQPPGPEPIQVPDVRANIMKMLQEGKGQSTSEEEDLFAEAERQKKKTEKPSPPVKQPQETAKSAKEEKPLAAPASKPSASTGKPVELPIKEIVIEDLDDLKKLAEELKRAKERQTGK